MTKLTLDRELEQLAFGEEFVRPSPRLGRMRVLRSMVAYWKSRFIFRRGGFPASVKYLDSLRRSFSPIDVESALEGQRLASKGIVILNIEGKLIPRLPRCLESSVAQTAGLIALGLPAQVVIAKAPPPVRSMPFHAWTEVFGTPVVEDLNAKGTFWVLTKYPDWDGL